MRLSCRALLIAALSMVVPLSALADDPRVSAVTGSALPRQQAQDALDHHNAKRRDVGVAPLQWSAELAAIAQLWADQLARDRRCGLMHKPDNRYGENLFGGSGAAWTAKDASEAWYSEINDYRYAVLDDDNWSAAGHYTQMVWRTTTRLGMGVARCANGAMVITAEYDPAGNIIGEAPY